MSQTEIFPSNDVSLSDVSLSDVSLNNVSLSTEAIASKRRAPKSGPSELRIFQRTHALSVLHLINGEHFSGAERVQQLLGKRLPECGVSADFACLKPGKFLQMCDLSPDRVFSIQMKGRMDRDVANRVGNLVKAGDYDLLHAHTPRSAMIASRISKKFSIPWIYHVHSPTARDSSRSLLNRINDFIERWSLKNCAKIITVSRSLRRELLERGIERTRLSCIPNGVPLQNPIDALARKDQETWKLGMVALFRPRKGLEILLEAISQWPSSGPKIQLEVIGGFETKAYEAEILRMVDKLSLKSIVSFSGFTKDVPGRLANLDGMVLPSLYGEGMPMVVLEALAAAVPVIATSVEGTPEVVRNGVEGLLATPRDVASLRDALLQFTSNRSEWIQMSSRALARHRDRYSDLQMAKATAATYRRLIFP
ncbi:MAG: glycosyltransferase [Pirellulaceae bacterium]|nr:glycosyltransferase [Pirellulaceae bacterium]